VLASQARRRGFESLHPLFYQKDVSSSLDVSLEELVLFVLDEKARRRLLLRTKSNKELFPLYKAELALRIRNQKNLARYGQVLDQFQAFLGDNPPSAMLAKSFLSKWSKSKPATLYKYLGIIKGFLNWFGEDIDLKVKLPRQLPEYIEHETIQKLIASIKTKQTHKKDIGRDILLVELAYNSGLRREGLANLKVGDILIAERALIVRRGKGLKDRTVPLPSRVFKLLEDYIQNMNKDDRVFGVKPAAISDKISRMAKRAGVNIHAHSLRHAYATRLLEKGANIKAVQELLGHSRISTTEAYLSLLPKHLRETVDLLDNSIENDLTSSSTTTQVTETRPSDGVPEHYIEDHTIERVENAKGKLMERHLAQLANVAEILAHQVNRLVRYQDDSNIEAVGKVLGHLSFWTKADGMKVVEGSRPFEEFEYEKQHPIDSFLAKCLYNHYEYRFGKQRFEEWNQLSKGYVDRQIENNLNLLASAGLKSCPSCPVCQEIESVENSNHNSRI
jgi:site-specific recombinase XerD